MIMTKKKYCMFCKKIIAKAASVCPNCDMNLIRMEYRHKVRCSYCNVLIPSGATYCECCGKYLQKEDVNINDEKVFEYKSSFINKGGNYFKIDQTVHVFIKNGRISFKTFGNGSINFDIKTDFLLCEKISDTKAKMMKLSIKKESYIIFVFNENSFILEENDVSESILCYIYKLFANQIYETENILYNTEHNKFSIF